MQTRNRTHLRTAGRIIKAVKTSPERIVFSLLLTGFSLTSHADHLSGGFGIGDSGPIMTESALPLEGGKWNVGIKSEFVENKDLSDARLITLRGTGIDRDGEPDEDLHNIDSIFGVSLNASYGLTDDITVGLRLPYVKRNNIHEPEEGHAHDGNPIVIHNIIDHGDSAGIGDLTLFGFYRFYNADDHHASILLGLKTPTGETDKTGFKNEYAAGLYQTQVIPDGDHDHHEGTVLETHQQPGSGSWDGSVGLAYSYHPGNINFDSSILYTLVTEGAQRTDLGDVVSYNLAVSRPTTRLAPCDFCSWDLILELNGERRARETRDGVEVGNSGGHILYLSPGLRLNFGNGLNLSASFGYPVVRDLNGDQSEPDYRFVGAVNYGF